MRPSNVVLAETLYLVSIVLVAVGAATTWRIAATAYGPGVAAGTILFAVLVPLILLLLATRRRSRIALWLVTAWTAFSVWSVLRQASLGTPVRLAGWLTIAQVVLMVVAVVLLFGRPARAWFAGRAGRSGFGA